MSFTSLHEEFLTTTKLLGSIASPPGSIQSHVFLDILKRVHFMTQPMKMKMLDPEESAFEIERGYFGEPSSEDLPIENMGDLLKVNRFDRKDE